MTTSTGGVVVPDVHLMKKQERAHFFSSREQELILQLFEQERDVLTAKSNTSSASRLREEAWQRIADRINAVSHSGYRRSWQQVKVKHKNIMQTAKRRRVELIQNRQNRHRSSVTPPPSSAEDELTPPRDGGPRAEPLPGAARIDALDRSDGSFISVSGRPVLLLPVVKSEPESLSSDDTDVSEGHLEEELHSSSCQDRAPSSCAPRGGRDTQRQTEEDLRSLYCRYLKKEMENREQQMEHRALKMRKLEKELLLLDKQLG